MGIKQYGYQYFDNEKLIDKSVFAGVQINSLSYSDILKLSTGEILNSGNSIRFHKSFNNLSITIKEINLTIKATRDKQLVNNKYVPLNVNLINSDNAFLGLYTPQATQQLVQTFFLYNKQAY